MKFSIIFPAYNEEKRICNTLTEYSNFFKGEYEFIVVSDGSKDKTCEIVREFIKKDKRTKLIELKHNVGKGGAIAEGLKKSKGDIVGFTDADNAFEISGVKNLMSVIERGDADCTIASKWENTKFENVAEPFSRKVFSKGWNYLIRIIFGLKLKDTQGGAKFVSRAVLNRIRGRKYVCMGFSFDVEFLYIINKNGFRVKEVFVPSKYVTGSTFKFRYMVTMLIDILRLRLTVGD